METTVQVGDVYGPGNWRVISRSKSRQDSWEVVNGKGSEGLLDDEDVRVKRFTLVSRAAPVTTGAPAGPPKGYRRCGVGACAMWIHPDRLSGMCWPHYKTIEGVDGDSTSKAQRPDWSPVQPAPEAGEVIDADGYAEADSPLKQVSMPCGEAGCTFSAHGPIDRAQAVLFRHKDERHAPKAKPVEAARCALGDAGCDGPVTRRYRGQNTCTAHELHIESTFAARTPSTAVPLPADYTLPKPAPYVCNVDDWDLLEDE